MQRSRTLLFLLGLTLFGIATPLLANLLQPGLYEVQVETGMPNDGNRRGAPSRYTVCVTKQDLENGHAFRAPRGHQYDRCELKDYMSERKHVNYRVVCPGPNAPSGEGEFLLTATGYQGTVSMQMGGKNMTMFQKYSGKRIGDCSVSH